MQCVHWTASIKSDKMGILLTIKKRRMGRKLTLHRTLVCHYFLSWKDDLANPEDVSPQGLPRR